MNKFFIGSLSTIIAATVLAGCAPQQRKVNGGAVTKAGGGGGGPANTNTSAAQNPVIGTPGQKDGNNPSTTPLFQSIGLSPTNIRTHFNKSKDTPGTLHFDITFNPGNIVVNLTKDPSGAITLDNATTQTYISNKDLTWTCLSADSPCSNGQLKFTLQNKKKTATLPVSVNHNYIKNISATLQLMKGTTDVTNLLKGADATVFKSYQTTDTINDGQNSDIIFKQFFIERAASPDPNSPSSLEITGSQNQATKPGTTAFVKLGGSLGNDETGQPLTKLETNVALGNITFQPDESISFKLNAQTSAQQTETLIFTVVPDILYTPVPAQPEAAPPPPAVKPAPQPEAAPPPPAVKPAPQPQAAPPPPAVKPAPQSPQAVPPPATVAQEQTSGVPLAEVKPEESLPLVPILIPLPELGEPAAAAPTGP